MVPSTRGTKFGVLVLVLQAAFVLLLGLFGEYKDRKTSNGMADYPNFQDVNTIVMVGIGLLLTYLKRYSLSGITMNMMVAVISIQWSAIVVGFIHADILGGEKFQYGVISMVECAFASTTVLISTCGLLGKASPIQLVVMAIFEIVFAQINRYIGFDILHVTDIGEAIFIHMFGAYFGMAVARVLYDPDVKVSTKEKSVYLSDVFSVLGTLVLWVYWPSFNGGFAGVLAENAVVNTYLSLCAATLMTFALTAFLEEHGKFEMVYIQNATLAGGVVMGCCCHMPMMPWVATLVGSAAGMVCMLAFRSLTPAMLSRFQLHDTCGIHNLHAIPGWMSVLVSAILVATASVSTWGHDLEVMFSEIRVVNGSITEDSRTLGQQAGYQIAAGALTMAFALVSGLFTGAILKLPIWNAPKGDMLFDDADNFVLPEGSPDDKLTSRDNISKDSKL